MLEAPAQLREVLLLGPSLQAVSGVSTHLTQLMRASLTEQYCLSHFQVGSEGRSETRVQKVVRLLTSPLHLLSVILREKPKIIHVNTSVNAKAFWRDAVYLFVSRFAGRKVIYQVHGGVLPQEFFAQAPFLNPVFRLVLRSADVVVVLGEIHRRAYSRFAPGIDPWIIPNAIDPSALVMNSEPNHQTEGLHLVYLGRLVRSKGIFEMVEAVRLLESRGVEVMLSIAGSGSDQPALQESVAAAGLTERIRLLGPLYGADKENLWHWADIFLFPTYHDEGLPYALLESMVVGTVPVVTPVAAIPDVMKDGIHGLFVPPRDPWALADAVEKLHRDRDLLDAMARECHRRILEYYTLDRLGRDFQRLYDSL